MPASGAHEAAVRAAASAAAAPYDPFWRLNTVNQFFGQAFETFGPSARTERGAGDAMVGDVIELSPAGLRLEYSRQTAEWLTEVVQRPHDYSLIFGYLTQLLSSHQHPLGRLCMEFGVLLCRLLESADPSRLNAPLSTTLDVLTARTPTSPIAAPPAHSCSSSHSDEDARERCRHGVACMKLGTSKLLSLVLDLLPPLQIGLASRGAADTVQSVLFEASGHAILALLRDAHGHEGESVSTKVVELAGLLPHHLDLSPKLWLGSDDVLDQNTSAQVGVISARDGKVTQRANTGKRSLPYQEVIALVATIPQVAAPRQKMVRFCEACAEVSNCVTRYHQRHGQRVQQGQALALGAEQLIAVMAYVLVRAQLPHVILEFRLVEMFMENEQDLLGSLGYGIATFHAAIRLILSLNVGVLTAQPLPSNGPPVRRCPLDRERAVAYGIPSASSSSSLDQRRARKQVSANTRQVLKQVVEQVLVAWGCNVGSTRV